MDERRRKFCDNLTPNVRAARTSQLRDSGDLRDLANSLQLGSRVSSLQVQGSGDLQEMDESRRNSETICRPTCRRELHSFETAEIFETRKTACSLEAELHYFKTAEIFEEWMKVSIRRPNF